MTATLSGADKTPVTKKVRIDPHAETLTARGFESRDHSKTYSRRVFFLKVALPLIAFVLITLVMIWPHLKVTDTAFKIGFSSVKVAMDDDPSMHNARYFGADDKKQPYSITADLATAMGGGVTVVELEMPKADIALEDGTWLVLTAKNGVYRRDTETMDLSGAVNLFHDAGYEFHTEKARINLKASSASSDIAVSGQGPFGNIKAEGFRLLDKGKRIIFLGKSKLILYPGAAGAKDQ